MTVPAQATARAVQARCALIANQAAGAYRRLVLAAPGIAAAAEPGQFVAAAVGGTPTATLLRRAFAIAATGDTGTVEIVVAARGPGSTWLAGRRPGEAVDLAGPLGRRFPQPEPGSRVVLVGGGYGSAPLVWAARALHARGVAVDAVLGAASAERLFGVAECSTVAGRVEITTDDGSAGLRGRVTDALPGLLGGGAVEVLACGPTAMLRAVAEVAASRGRRAWLSMEESMACGIGVCMTCVLAVRDPADASGGVRMARSCIEGPTFAADALVWEPA